MMKSLAFRQIKKTAAVSRVAKLFIHGEAENKIRKGNRLYVI